MTYGDFPAGALHTPGGAYHQATDAGSGRCWGEFMDVFFPRGLMVIVSPSLGSLKSSIFLCYKYGTSLFFVAANDDIFFCGLAKIDHDSREFDQPLWDVVGSGMGYRTNSKICILTLEKTSFFSVWMFDMNFWMFDIIKWWGYDVWWYDWIRKPSFFSVTGMMGIGYYWNSWQPNCSGEFSSFNQINGELINWPAAMGSFHLGKGSCDGILRDFCGIYLCSLCVEGAQLEAA